MGGHNLHNCDAAKKGEGSMTSKAIAAATEGKKLHAPQPQAKVRINFKEPLKTGFLSKAGGKSSKSYKNRFFVLYKNFLVYYDDEIKWKRDITVERLEVSKLWPCSRAPSSPGLAVNEGGLACLSVVAKHHNELLH